MNKQELNKFIDKISPTGPGGIEKIKRVLKTVLDKEGEEGITEEELLEALATKQDTIQDLSEIRSGAALGATAYQKPSAGIPSTDMSSAVQNSLELAVGSLQKTAQTLTAAEKAQVWNNLGIKEGVSRVVSTLPTTEIDENIVYLVPTANAGEFTEYKYNGSSWENLGTFTVPAPTVVNDLETGGSTSALSAEMGKVLDGKVSQLGQDVEDNTDNINALKAEIDAIQPIVIEGNVTNAPDEEDITTDENDLLKFKDRTQAVNQMGYVILRKNKTFAEQVTKENTIYEIRYAFTLSANFTIPSGCILRFDGGSISGAYTLTGNNTFLSFSSKDAVIDGVILKGTWANTEFDVRNFGIVASPSFDCADITKMLLETQKDIFFPSGNYCFSELYLENTASGNFSIRGEESDSIRPLTAFFPISNNQRYIIKGGGGKNTLGGPGRCYGLKIISVNFRSLAEYAPDSLTVNYSDTHTDYPFGLLLLDKVERGQFRIFGNTAYNAPIIGIGYSYELTFDLFTVYGFRGKSDCPLFNIVNNQGNSYSAIVIKQMMIESVTGPIIGTATKAAGSELYIGSLNFEGTIVGKSTPFYTEPNWSDYNEVPLFDLKYMCKVNVNNISLTTLNITYTNTYGEQSEDCIRTFLKVTDYYAAAAYFGKVINGGTSTFLHFSGNALTNYKSSVVGDFSTFRVSGNIANLYLSISRRIDGISVLPTGEVFFNDKLAELCTFSMSNSFLINSDAEGYNVACFITTSGGIALNHNGFYINSKYLKIKVTGSVSVPTLLKLNYLDVNGAVLSSDSMSIGKAGIQTVWFEIRKPAGFDHIQLVNETIGVGKLLYEISAVDDISGLFGDTKPNNVSAGTIFFDEVLGKNLIYNGYTWVNTDGTFARHSVAQLRLRVPSGTNRLVQMYAKDGNECVLTVLTDGVTITSVSGNAVKVNDKTVKLRPYASGYNGFLINGSDEVFFDVEITNFGGLEYISNISGCNFGSFADCDSLKLLSITGLPPIGDLVQFAKESPILGSFNLQPKVSSNKTFYGNLTAFGNNTHIKTISISSVVFRNSDSIENFVSMQRAAGRTDTSNDKLRIKCYGCYGLSFNGAILETSNSLVDFYWTATTITIDSTTITA